METIIIRTDNKEQSKTIKAILKAIKVQYETKMDDNKVILKRELKEAFLEMKKIKEGKAKGRPVENLLNEL